MARDPVAPERAELAALLGSFLSYYDISGERGDEAKLAERLSQFSRDSCVSTAACLTALIAEGRFLSQPDLQLSLCKQVFSPEILQRIEERLRERGATDRIVFFGQQLLTLMEAAVRHCTGDGRPIRTSEDLSEWGQCCLMASEVWEPSPEIAPEEAPNYLAAMVLRQLNFLNTFAMKYQIARCYRLFVELPHITRAAYDFDAAFRRTARIGIEAYIALLFGIYARASRCVRSGIGEDTCFAETEFRPVTKIGTDEYASTFAQMTQTLDELKDDIGSARGVGEDHHFFALRTKPLLRLDSGRLVCAHPQFLAHKMSDGIYWAMADGLRGDEKGFHAFSNAFGKLFEEEVRDVLNHYLPCSSKPDAPVEPPEYGTRRRRKQASDAIVMSGDSVVFIEAKTSRLKLEVYAHGDIETFVDDMKERSVLKAAQQLATVIRDFQDGRFEVAGRDYNSFTRIFPVVVTLTPIIQHPFLARLRAIKRAYRRMRFPPKVRSRPYVHVLDIDELETLVASQVALPDVLESWYNDRAMKHFCVANFILHDRLPAKDMPRLDATWARIDKEVLARYFAVQDGA